MTATLVANVVDLRRHGRAAFPGEVLIESGRIEAVARGGERIAAAGAEIVDGGGGTLMPGLIEPHAHLTFTCSSIGWCRASCRRSKTCLRHCA